MVHQNHPGLITCADSENKHWGEPGPLPESSNKILAQLQFYRCL